MEFNVFYEPLQSTIFFVKILFFCQIKYFLLYFVFWTPYYLSQFIDPKTKDNTQFISLIALISFIVYILANTVFKKIRTTFEKCSNTEKKSWRAKKNVFTLENSKFSSQETSIITAFFKIPNCDYIKLKLQ